MGGLAALGRPRFRFDELDPQAAKVGFDLRDPAGGGSFALTRVGQPATRRLNRFGKQSIPAREEHLLPAPQLVSQLLIPPRLARLALERPALLLHLEHDVVDAREVLLGRFELERGGPPARLVFRDARRLLDQLTPIGRPRAQDHPDLPLLDDRVGLGPEARVHQQVVHVAQPADLAVDQVLALARAVEPPRHFDIACHGSESARGLLLLTLDAGRRREHTEHGVRVAARRPRGARCRCRFRAG